MQSNEQKREELVLTYQQKMSWWLPDKKLLLSLARHFHIKSLLLCLGGGADDAAQIYQSQLLTAAEGASVAVNFGGDPCWNPSGSGGDLEEEATLVVCRMNKLCDKLLNISSSESRSLMTTLVPDVPSQTLRLDDTLLTVNETSGIVWEWYGLGRGTQNQRTILGIWSSFKGMFTPRSHLPKWESRSDLKGLVLRVAVEQWDPISMKGAGEEEKEWTGMIVNVVETMKMALNFSTRYITPADGLWGGKVIKHFFTNIL